MTVWQRIKGWFRRKPAEVVPFHAEGMIRPEPDPELRQVLFNHGVSSLVERDAETFDEYVARRRAEELADEAMLSALLVEPDPANANPPDPASDWPAQFVPAVCSCCKCQPSIYRTYGDGTVLCVECAG
jgi:hypothetical protein